MSNEKQDYIIDEINELIMNIDLLISYNTGLEKEKYINMKNGLSLAIVCVYEGAIKYLEREQLGKQSEFSKQILNQ